MKLLTKTLHWVLDMLEHLLHTVDVYRINDKCGKQPFDSMRFENFD